MGRAYASDANNCFRIGLRARCPAKEKTQKWDYDKELYKQRNERFFRRLKRFRRIFTRYDKLDTIFAGVILYVMIIDSLVWTLPSCRKFYSL